MVSKGAEDNVRTRYETLKRDADRSGYHLNPDYSFTSGLIEGLLINQNRYGYESCPCRLSYGDIDQDRDIICPCDYRDPDLVEFATCYCGLYVNSDLFNRKESAPSIPERRPPRSERQKSEFIAKKSGLPYPVWRCRVCGYLCAREQPPEICPVCKARNDRFEQFM